MGACCSTDRDEGRDWVEMVNDDRDDEFEGDDGGGGGGGVSEGDLGARVRLRGSNDSCCMFTKQGRKGINQDAMAVWEDFNGQKDAFFCGVFDGHGPVGHRVAHHVRDNLPMKLSSVIQSLQNKESSRRDLDLVDKDDEGQEIGEKERSDNARESCEEDFGPDMLLSTWEASFIKSFKEIDEELSLDSSIDSFCSGTTAVTMVKQGDHLIIANLGDSRAVLCTRGQKNQPVPIQLTVDLKPNIKSEADRIKKCKGRVFAMDEEPEVFRVWLPDENCPGLAMARAFGDFCLKDYGLISTPEVSYRKLTQDDEFVVLATDGVWDVLSNVEVVRIVASAKKRSVAAKLLVAHAVTAWKTKYPGCKIDDCAVICLFFKNDQPPSQSIASAPGGNPGQQENGISQKSGSNQIEANPDTMLAGITEDSESAVDGVSRVDSLIRVPHTTSLLSRRRAVKEPEHVEVH
ncbi:probable protein phosphatase 2C 65 [Rhodamnia argentea]|uniref:Probable protein phosphatase 2C 65 n=1 Tax=Rhodamnia argentea TaxID=178133 RepID=A0A8B8Q445_9MYRT|nr:probable protein phosphatase 2C 65 [Rhodamnia argentea]